MPLCRFHVAAAAALLLAFGASARAADSPFAPQGVVNLEASASVDVPRDILGVTLVTSRDGADAAAVQRALRQTLEAALTEAKKAARPGQVDVQTGNFTLFPRYDKQGVISGWQGSAELVVEGRDMPAIAALTGRIAGMSVARVSYSLSREAREKVEGELAAQAIARYRAKAADYAKQFGYGGFSIREVSVNTDEAQVPQPPMRMKALVAASEALPVEAGNGTVRVNVNGSVQMLK